MGERTALRFVSPSEKSVWLYFHYADDFRPVSDAIAFIQALKPDPSSGRRNDPDAVVASFLRYQGESGPQRIFDSTLDYGKGDGMDWGVWEVDIHTGVATAFGEGSHGVTRMDKPNQWDSEERCLRPSAEGEKVGVAALEAVGFRVSDKGGPSQ